PSSWSDTSVVAPVPSGATTGPVVITVNGEASNGVTFTVQVAPSITSLSPTSGAAGTAVTITGTNFGATQRTSTVKFNGVTATPTSWSTTSIQTTVPATATTGPVVVTVSALASNGVTFTVPTLVSWKEHIYLGQSGREIALSTDYAGGKPKGFIVPATG